MGMLDMGGKGRHILMTWGWQLRSWPSFWPPAATPATHRKWTPADVCRTTYPPKAVCLLRSGKDGQGLKGYDQMSVELLAYSVCNSHQVLKGWGDAEWLINDTIAFCLLVV